MWGRCAANKQISVGRNDAPGRSGLRPQGIHVKLCELQSYICMPCSLRSVHRPTAHPVKRLKLPNSAITTKTQHSKENELLFVMYVLKLVIKQNYRAFWELCKNPFFFFFFLFFGWAIWVVSVVDSVKPVHNNPSRDRALCLASLLGFAWKPTQSHLFNLR